MRRLHWAIATCAGLACLTLLQPSLAATVDATHDTWVREDSADSNRNGNDQMNARTDLDADDNDVILLRFPTTDIPDGVSGLSLNLYWQRSDSSSSNELKLYGLNETDTDETAWTESTVTYNNAPGLLPDGVDPATESGNGATFDEIQDLDVANLTLLVPGQGYGPQVLDEEYSFSSAALDAFVNADTNGEVTFLILRANESTSGNQARFWPKESGTAPNLSFVPEPSSVALLGLLTLVAGVAARRR